MTDPVYALIRYFLTAPELQRIAHETMEMTGMMDSTNQSKHHLGNISAATTQDKGIMKISKELERVGNPFTSVESDLINIATKTVFNGDIATDVGRMESLGAELQVAFNSERIKTVNLWAPIKRNKLKLCSSSRKKVTVKSSGVTSELSADISLFARLLILTRSQRDVDLEEETLGKYEMSAVPRSLFAFDGTMNLCSSKSKLISILQALELPTEFESEMVEQDHTLQPTSIMESFSVAIVWNGRATST